MEEGYYYLNNFDNILNSFGECRKPRWAVVPTGPRCWGVQLAEDSPSPGRLPHLLESSLAPMEPLVCPAWGAAQARPQGSLGRQVFLHLLSFPSIGEQQSFTLGWDGYSLMLGSHPPCHNPSVMGGAQPQCPVHPGQAHTALLLVSTEKLEGQWATDGRGLARCSFLRAPPHDIPRPRRSGGLFLRIPTLASRASEAKDACFGGQAETGPLPMGQALWKGLGRSLWSSQPRLADRCLVPRIGGERPLTPLCKSGSD